ncbi:hypothetical protein B1R94_09605 [Mycolicibacterium litorale]|nr:hypothetical protein B1R94_09605 [Mycolicibacterium litorale]
MATEVGRVAALLNRVRPPAGPITGRWALGIGDIVADATRLPQRLRGAVRLLNRFGGVAVTAESLEFDGDDVKWSKVTELDTRNLVEYLLSGAVEKQVDRLPVPWFPGRGKLLGLASAAVLTLLMATARQQIEDHADIRIPAEVHYRGLVGGDKVLSPGVLATLILADPRVSECVVATATANGVTVRKPDDDPMDAAGERAEQLKAGLAALEQRVGALLRCR